MRDNLIFFVFHESKIKIKLKYFNSEPNTFLILMMKMAILIQKMAI